MEWLRPYLICRARVACLRAIVEAGGDLADWQLRRAIEPVLGDLLPLPEEPLPSKEARAEALRQSLWWDAEARRREALGSRPEKRTSFDAVDSRPE